MNAAPVITSPLDGRTTSDADPFEAGRPAAPLPLGWDELVYIPELAKRVALWRLEPSLPALLFLNSNDFWVAGNLHGWSYPELRLKPGCDLGIMAELRHLVDALQQAHGISPADIRKERRQQQLERQRRPGARRTPAELWPGQFTVPEIARSWDPLSFPLSTRMKNILRRRGIRCLGELHNLPVAELKAQGDCGARSIAGLKRFLQSAEDGEVALATYCFDVPENIRFWNVFELPLSVRLETVLRNLGITIIGGLHGMPHQALLAAKGCGPKSLAKLQQVLARAARGDFNPPLQRAGWQPKTLIQILDALVGFLPDREGQIFCDRLGAESGELEMLESIARRAGITKQWVSQVALVCVIRIRKSGSLPLKFHLERLKARCNMAHCALSPDVLGRWLDAGSATPRFALPFYIRLIARLDPDIKAEGI